MRKIILVALAIFAICITVSAVSADDSWSFSFGSESNSDGGSVEVVNNELKIQDEKFTIPDGFKEMDKERVLGNDSTTIDGGKVSTCILKKGDEAIVISVNYADSELKNITTPDDAENKTIGGHDGFLLEDENGNPVFQYIDNNKIIAIGANNEANIEAVLK